MCGAYRLQFSERRKNSPLPGRRVFPLFGIFPGEIAPVQVTRIVPLVRIFVITVVIPLSDLVTGINHWHARQRKQEGMQHDVKADSAIQLPLVALIFRRLNAAERRRGTAKSCIADSGIVIVELAPRVGAVEIAPEKVVQKVLVPHFINAELF